ncbi:MAG TPA: IS1 family transposase [Methanothrix sp.]|nr:IS1 family transposase [Methanothrix sp.]
MADELVKEAARKLKNVPIFVTDGLNFYKIAILKQYGKLETYRRTGKPGRPRGPKVVISESVRYAQVIKKRSEGKIVKVIKKVIFGSEVDQRLISTSYIERQNLTLRQDNNRISRKTIGFSKQKECLKESMTLYLANFNFCRKHRGLEYEDEDGVRRYKCPAWAQGLTDHIWSLHELLTFPYYKKATN